MFSLLPLLILHFSKHCPCPLSFPLFWAASSSWTTRKPLLTGSSINLCCSTSTWPKLLFNNPFNHHLSTHGTLQRGSLPWAQSRSNHWIIGKCHLIFNWQSWSPCFFFPSLIATSFLFLQKKAVSTLLLLIVALFLFTLFFMTLRFFLLTTILMVLCQQPSSTQPWTFHYGKFCLLPVWKYSIAIPCQHENPRNKFQQKNGVCLNLLFISLVLTQWPSPLLFDNKLYRVNA